MVVTDDNKTQKKPNEEDDDEHDEEMEVGVVIQSIIHAFIFPELF